MAKKSEKEKFDIRFLEPIVKQRPDYIEALSALAEAYTACAFYQKGLELDERLSRLCPQDPVVFYNLACSQALLRHKEEAFRSLASAVKLGYGDFKHLLQDPDLYPLREDPRFQKFAEEMKKNDRRRR